MVDIHKAINLVRGRADTMIIRYEELAMSPDDVQQRLVSRYGLAFESTFSSFDQKPEKHAYRYEGKYVPIDTSLVREGERATGDRIGRWRVNLQDIDRVVQQFRSCNELFEILETLGYEASRDWFSQLCPNEK